MAPILYEAWTTLFAALNDRRSLQECPNSGVLGACVTRGLVGRLAHDNEEDVYRWFRHDHTLGLHLRSNSGPVSRTRHEQGSSRLTESTCFQFLRRWSSSSFIDGRYC